MTSASSVRYEKNAPMLLTTRRSSQILPKKPISNQASPACSSCPLSEPLSPLLQPSDPANFRTPPATRALAAPPQLPLRRAMPDPLCSDFIPHFMLPPQMSFE
eukprot:IDg15885t1